MILEILWCPIFTPLVILQGEVKMGLALFLLQVCPIFTPNCEIKTGYLESNFLN